jgi:hypothetical protein
MQSEVAVAVRIKLAVGERYQVVAGDHRTPPSCALTCA